MKFIKMHGCGNDYIYLDAVTAPGIESLIGRTDWAVTVGRMSDRHKGIGGDGVIVVCTPTERGRRDHAHVRMRMFNADGSEAEMCGNGVRCVAKLAHDRLGVNTNPMRVETGRGVLSITCEVRDGKLHVATVDMGEPILDLERIPVNSALLASCGENLPGLWRFPGVKGYGWMFVSMGNPHAVLTTPEVPSHDPLGYVREWGLRTESHPAFPRRVNVHFVRNVERGSVEVLSWERGAGITQACGTGACAVLVAGVLTGRMDREATIRLIGGDLRVRWDEATNHVFMTGEAVEVFEGEWREG